MRTSFGIKPYIYCLAIAVVAGMVMYNTLFLKAVFHMNYYNSGEQIDNVISKLIFDKNGYSMIISGSGDMSEYTPIEWSNALYNQSSGWKVSIRSVRIEEGVTSISKCLFMGCSKLKTVDIPHSMLKIGTKAFAYCNGLEEINYNGTVNEWSEVVAHSPLWNDESSIHSVICSDGSVSY